MDLASRLRAEAEPCAFGRKFSDLDAWDRTHDPKDGGHMRRKRAERQLMARLEGSSVLITDEGIDGFSI